MSAAPEGATDKYATTKRAWYLANREKVLAYNREYHHRPDVRERRRQQNREWKKRNADKVRAQRERIKENGKSKEYHRKYFAKDEVKRRAKDYALRRKYGISLDDYERMLESQGGACAICRSDRVTMHRRSDDPAMHVKTRLVVDHDHDTGTIRGLLCGHCNRAIGLLMDRPDIVGRAAAYLQEVVSVRASA